MPKVKYDYSIKTIDDCKRILKEKPGKLHFVWPLNIIGTVISGPHKVHRDWMFGPYDPYSHAKNYVVIKKTETFKHD